MPAIKLTDLPLVDALTGVDSLLLLDADTATSKRVSMQQIIDHVGGGDVYFADILSTPNTLIGYGITDGVSVAVAANTYQGISVVLTATTASYTIAEQSKLATIAAGATVNASDAALRDRATHSGTQLANSISNFDTAVDARLTGKADVLHTHSFDSLTLKPTTLSGYGITDGATTSALTTGLATKAATSHSHSFASITAKPTSLTGYGITDAQPLASVLTATTASYTIAEQNKLSGIAAGATVNASDNMLLSRTNHTGTQAISTVEGLETALALKASNTHTHSYTNLTDVPEIITRGQILAMQLGIY